MSTFSNFSRYLRRPQFGLRSVLVLTLIAAALFWWISLPRTGEITKYQASKIHKGMLKTEVEAILGPPNPTYRDAVVGDIWLYEFQQFGFSSQQKKLFYVFFDGSDKENPRVQSINNNSDKAEGSSNK